MNIEIANKAGFCFGVKRAIKMAYEARENSGGKPVYTLGPLVHNPQVIEKLERDGIRSVEVDDLEDSEKGTLLIRTHGVSPDIMLMARELGYDIINATCPLVKKIHDIVVELQEEDYPILVIGHAAHPEVQGISGEIKGWKRVIEKVEEVKDLEKKPKLGVVVQTTALWPQFREIAQELLDKAQEVRIFNTICHATMERQAAAEELAKKADMMIIIGGKTSSNTRRLLEISRRVNPNSYHVESVEELQDNWFEGKKVTGITAGASTPDYIINRIKNRIIGIKNKE